MVARLLPFDLLMRDIHRQQTIRKFPRLLSRYGFPDRENRLRPSGLPLFPGMPSHLRHHVFILKVSSAPCLTQLYPALRPLPLPRFARWMICETLFILLFCRKENLLENHFPMTELELKRGESCCGYQFILHGPRSVKLSAVWDRSGNEVLMYDVVGKRFARVRLPHQVA